MGSRARIAAAACLVASGLLTGGGAATAVADPSSSASDDGAESRAEQSTRTSTTGKRSVERAEDGNPPATPGDGTAEQGEDTPDPKPDAEVPDKEPPPRGEDDDVDGEEEPRPPCCEKGDEDCGPGWPWPWPFPEPPDPVAPPTDENDSDNPPVWMPPSLPQRPPLVGGPEGPDVIDIIPGIDIGDSDLRTAPISVPVVATAPALSVSPAVSPGVGPSGAPGVGAPTPGGAPAALPAGPRQVSTSPPPARQPLPAAAGSSATIPTAGSRVGYGDYLRSAGISQIAVLALPGLAGILVLTGAGGLVGYRQAKAGQGVRSSGIARFMN